MKMSKCIRELERIYGIRNGSSNNKGVNQHIGDQDYLDDQITQSDLAKQIHVTDEQLRNYKKLNELIPELQSLVENGSLKAATG